MGYTTEFDGQISVEPPLNKDEVLFMNKFSGTRRMLCKQGPYYVDRGGMMGQDASDNGIIDYNTPPEGQPGLWCKWCATEDGKYIEWNGSEKFYCSDNWMKYIIDHFLRENPIAKEDLPFLQGHILNGEIIAQGKDWDDRWKLVVEENKVRVINGKFVFDETL